MIAPGSPRGDAPADKSLPRDASDEEIQAFWSDPRSWGDFFALLCEQPKGAASARRPLLPVAQGDGAPVRPCPVEIMPADEVGQRFGWLLRRFPSAMSFSRSDTEWGPLVLLALCAPKNGLGVARALLDAGADANAMSGDGMTPLLAAAMALCPFDELASSRDNDRPRPSSLSSALFSARAHARNASLETTICAAEDLIALLLERGADPAHENSRWRCDLGNTPLHWATLSRGNAIERLLAAGGAPAINWGNRSGQTPLHLAAAFEPARARALAAAGADFCSRDNAGATPLGRAAAAGNATGVATLLKLGADPLLWTGREGNSPLHEAARSKGFGAAASCRELLRRGAPVDSLDAEGATPLLRALAEGQAETAVALLEAGADALINRPGFGSPLCSLARRKSLRAELAASASSRKSVFEGVAAGKPPTGAMNGCAQALIERGADLDALDDKGLSALSLAIVCDGFPLALFLFASGAPFSDPQAFGQTEKAALGAGAPQSVGFSPQPPELEALVPEQGLDARLFCAGLAAFSATFPSPAHWGRALTQLGLTRERAVLARGVDKARAAAFPDAAGLVSRGPMRL